MDLFNFSRKPGGDNETILKNFNDALKFRQSNIELITKGSFNPVKTENEKVFAYSRKLKDNTIIVIGNLDFKNPQNGISIKDNSINKKTGIEIIAGNDNIKLVRRHIHTDLSPGEIKVIRLINKNRQKKLSQDFI